MAHVDRAATDRGRGVAKQLIDLGERYFRIQHSFDPWNATLLGLTEFDHLVGDPRKERGDAAVGEFASLEKALFDIDGEQLDSAGRVDLDILTQLTRGARREAEDSLWAANASAESYVSRQGLVFQALPVVILDSPSASEAYLERLAGLAVMFDRLGKRYLEEAAQGRVPTAVGVQHAVQQLEGYMALSLAHDALLAPAQGLKVAEVAARLVDRSIRPAMDVLAGVLREQLAPMARGDAEVGICFIPGGSAAYLRAVARHTTTSESPEAIHQIGLETLAELKARWREVSTRALGVGDFGESVRRLRADPTLRFSTSSEIVEMAHSALDRAVAAQPRYFAGEVPPCAIVEISPVESEHGSLAYYRPPAVDGSRPGAYCLLTANPTERFRFEYECLAFHESVPGHHLQLATSQGLDIPRYRRHLDVEACSFNEGWGLYSERLADELGLYTSDLDVLGHLSFLSLRACRLVVDTGMHHLGWSRQQAIDFMTMNTATTEVNIRNEVDRYIAWPGQALAYVMGQREIIRLRTQSQVMLRDDFDLASFHACVLGQGSVPLSVLARNVHQWQTRCLSSEFEETEWKF